jgi:hypothetical protein
MHASSCGEEAEKVAGACGSRAWHVCNPLPLLFPHAVQPDSRIVSITLVPALRQYIPESSAATSFNLIDHVRLSGYHRSGDYSSKTRTSPATNSWTPYLISLFLAPPHALRESRRVLAFRMQISSCS